MNNCPQFNSQHEFDTAVKGWYMDEHTPYNCQIECHECNP